MNRTHPKYALVLVAALAAAATGCSRPPQAAPEATPAAPEAAPADVAAPATDASTVAVAPTAADPAAAAPVADPADEAVNAQIDMVLGNSAEYRRVFNALQQAVAANDAAAVATLVDYPITVAIDGKSRSIATAEEFVRAYGSIVTPAIAKVVADQRYSDLMVNAKGAMLGDGQVWINGICADDACANPDVRVVTIQAGP